MLAVVCTVNHNVTFFLIHMYSDPSLFMRTLLESFLNTNEKELWSTVKMIRNMPYTYFLTYGDKT